MARGEPARALSSPMDLVIRLDGIVDGDDIGGEDAVRGELGTEDRVCARWRDATGDLRVGLPFDVRDREGGITGRAEDGGLVGGGGGGKAGGR